MPHLWDGASLSDVNFDHHFTESNLDQLKFICLGDEGRVALECSIGEQFNIGPFAGSISGLHFSFGPLSAKGNVHDLIIRLDDDVVVELKGDLPPERWTDVVAPAIESNRIIRASIEYKGSGSVGFANPLPVGRVRKQQQSNVIVLVLDSLQPSQVGCYGGTDANYSSTPFIDKYFADHMRFANAFSQGEWTLPSVSSMMTGLYALQHGNYNPDAGSRALPGNISTLAEMLHAANYRTMCYSTGRRFVPPYGHYRGFDRFFYSDWHKPLVSLDVINTAIEFMAVQQEAPFFCFLHFYDPHPPFGNLSYYSNFLANPKRWSFPGEQHAHWKRHSDNLELVDELNRLCQIKTAQLDLWLNNLFAFLSTSGLDDSTTTFLLSDHGREYYKRTPLLTQKRVGVPLLVRGPSVEPGVNDAYVEPGVDLYPTILRLAGLDLPEHTVGKDLLLRQNPAREYAISESLYRGVYEAALRSKDWCYVYKCKMDPATGEIQTDNVIAELLFSRDNDRQNQYQDTDVLSQHPDISKEFREAVKNHCHNRPRHIESEFLIPMR